MDSVLKHPVGRLILWLVLSQGLWMLVRRAGSGSLFEMVMEYLIFMVVLFVAVRLAEGRPIRDIGLGGRRFVPYLAGGAALGALMMSAVIGVWAAIGWYRVDAIAWGRSETTTYLVWYFFLYLWVAFSEEVIMRGGILRYLEQAYGPWIALAGSSLLFGLAHQGGTLKDSLFIAVIGGLVWGAAYIYARSLWLPIGMHWAWNYFQGPVFGMAVSGGGDPSGVAAKGLFRPTVTGPDLWTGGSFGPEGGLVALILAGVVAAVMLYIAEKRGNLGLAAPHPSARSS